MAFPSTPESWRYAVERADDRRLAIETVEKVNRRLDHRWIEAQKNATERLKVKATVAAQAVRTWQPNVPPPEPDSELQALIDGAVPAEEDEQPGDADPADETK